MSFVVANVANSASNTVTTSATNLTGANWIGMLVICAASNNITAKSDSNSNAWAAHGSSVPKTVNGAMKGYVWYAENATVGSSQTFSATCDGTPGITIIILALSGRATSSSVEGSNYAADSSGTTSHTGGATGSHTAGDDAVGFLFDDEQQIGGRNETSLTAGSGWTIPTNGTYGDGRNYPCGAIQYIGNTDGSSKTCTWTSAVSNVGGAFVVAVKASGGGSSGNPWYNYANQ